VRRRWTTTKISAARVLAPRPLPAPPLANVADEARLLREAHAALSTGDAAHALALLDEHARAHPAGALAEERDAERVVVLCKLGRASEARTEARRFLAGRPDSPLAAGVRASCGGDGAR
jgi:hypothetical protein